MRLRKPCLFRRLRLLGWKVRFKEDGLEIIKLAYLPGSFIRNHTKRLCFIGQYRTIQDQDVDRLCQIRRCFCAGNRKFSFKRLDVCARFD